MTHSRQLATFYLDGLFFGIDVLKVQEVIRYQAMTSVPLATSTVRGLINLRGQIVTAIDLRRRLQFSERPPGQNPLNVVMRTDDGAVSLLVDAIGDVLDVLDETLEAPPPMIQGVARELITGVYKLEDRLLLVLATDKVLMEMDAEVGA